jgi:hypothetical protein
LITNDKSIVNRDFYRKENIFIIGRDEFNELPSFVSSPYLEINRKIVQKYEFEDWLNRFFETTENKELL